MPIDTSDGMKCPVHNVETMLRCGRCERPICDRCTVFGPAGARCRECASLRSSPLFQVSPARLAAGFLAALAAAFACGYLLITGAGFGFFLLWGGLIGGGLIGEAQLRVTARKRGPRMEACAGLATLLGILLAFAAWSAGRGLPLAVLAARPVLLVAAIIAIAAAVSRIRYM